MDITLQMSYVEGRWPQNCDRSKPTDYFTRVTQKLVKICISFIKRSAHISKIFFYDWKVVFTLILFGYWGIPLYYMHQLHRQYTY